MRIPPVLVMPGRKLALDPYEDPVIQGRRLRTAIRSIRGRMTQKDLAAALDWSVSKVVRIENGDTGISTTDLRALLAECGVREPARIDELVALARMSRRQAWAPYKELLPKNFLEYLSLEAVATTLRTYEASLLPGLLQTEEYATAIISAYREDSSDVTRARLVQLRMERQELLDRAAHQFSFVIDESSLRRLIGGSIELMRRQFEHLIAVADKPNVTLMVVPFGAGQYSGMGGPFVHLEFAGGPGDDDLVYLETAYNDFLIRTGTDDRRRFLETFFELEALARPAGELRRFTDRALEEMVIYQTNFGEPSARPDE
jgi:transcriptional regulator with XRE-family HTH domain